MVSNVENKSIITFYTVGQNFSEIAKKTVECLNSSKKIQANYQSYGVSYTVNEADLYNELKTQGFNISENDFVRNRKSQLGFGGGQGGWGAASYTSSEDVLTRMLKNRYDLNDNGVFDADENK